MRDITVFPHVKEFLCKLQGKVGELGQYIALRRHDESSLDLCKELIDVINAVCFPFNPWDDKQIQVVIDYYSLKASLNNIPYINMIGYKVTLRRACGDASGDAGNIVEFVDSTIANLQHNSLKGIQGGKPGEYYHLTSEQYDWIVDKTTIFVPPTVSLLVNHTSTPVIVDGSYLLNSGISALRARYYRDNILLVEHMDGDLGRTYEDTTPVTMSTTYRYEVDFQEGGTKSVSKVVSNTLPYFSGIGVAGLDRIVTNRVNVATRPTSLDITFNIPVDNATTMQYKPYVMYGKSWGLPQHIYVDGNTMFDTVYMWKLREVTATVDGVSGQYYLFEYDEYTEGQFTFNFRWVAI